MVKCNTVVTPLIANWRYQSCTNAVLLTPKCHHFDEIFVTGCTKSCQNDNFQCSQRPKISSKWQHFHHLSYAIDMLNICIPSSIHVSIHKLTYGKHELPAPDWLIPSHHFLEETWSLTWQHTPAHGNQLTTLTACSVEVTGKKLYLCFSKPVTYH